MAVPTLIVEIAFDDGPYVASPTWTDVSSYVISAQTRRGRSSDFDDTFTASASIVFNNNTRVFDPFNTSGIYYGKLSPRKQVRIRGTANGTTYGIFRGFINGFPVVWNGAGKESTVTIQAFDILGLLATSTLRGDLADVYTRSLSPAHYYKCSDAEGATEIVDFGSQASNLTKNPSYTPSFTAYSPLGIGLSGNSINFSNTGYRFTSGSATATSGNLTVCFWAAFPNSSFSDNSLVIEGRPSGQSVNDQLTFEPNSPTSGKGLVSITDNGATPAQTQTSSSNLTTIVANHYAITYDTTTGATKIYVNGVDNTGTTATDAGGVFIPARELKLEQCVFQEVAVFTSVLTSTEIENIYLFGAGSQSESTSDRLDRILTLSDIPASLYSVFATSFGVVLGVPKPNITILEALMQVMHTEGGYLYVDKDGILTAVNREFFLDNTASNTSQATLDDTGSNIPYSNEVSLYYDGDNIRNDIVVEYGNGVRATTEDATSISNYGRHTYSVRSQSSTADEADELAQHWLTYYKKIVPIVSTIAVGTNITSAQWATLLSLELLERITFKRTPPIGSSFEQFLCINSLELDMKPTNWVMRINGTNRFAPAQPLASVSAATSVTDTTATLNGTVSSNGLSTTIKFQYSTSSNFATYTEVNATPATTTGENVSVYANITGLTRTTTYYFRIVATNIIGTTTTASLSFVTTASAPTVTMSSTTNFNQSIATFNGTVSANGATTTTIKFQVSLNDSTWYDAVGGTAISNTSSQSVSVYYNATGYYDGVSNVNLSPNTLYYVRLVATNSIGTTNSTSNSFTTWALQVYERSTSGGTTFTIPTVTPTGGSAVSVSIYDIIVFGGGGGGGFANGGGGGGYQNIASRSMTGSRSVTTSVGAGGTPWSVSALPTVGSASTITGDLTTVSASGGGADTGGNNIAPSSGNGNAGGSNASYDPNTGDKTGPNNAYGGGGGAGAVGGNGTANANTTAGGNGGNGVSITSGGVTKAGGAGGGGLALENYTTSTGPIQGSQGSNNTYGSGGNPTLAGQAGYIRFRYYASSALA